MSRATNNKPGPALAKVHKAFQSAGSRNPTGDDWTCPADGHADKNASCTVRYGDEPGKIVVKCARCPTDMLLDSIGLEFSDLEFDPAHEFPRSAGDWVNYVYTDEDGNPLHRVRKRPLTDGDKEIQQQRWSGGRWVPGLGSRPRNVLYRLPELGEAIDNGWVIHLCEGEPDADALNEWFRANDVNAFATTHRGGAGKWRPEHTEAVADAAEIVAWADRDLGGYRCCAQRLKAVLDADVLARAVLPIPDFKGADARNHLEAKHKPQDALAVSLEELDDLANRAEALEAEKFRVLEFWPDPDPLTPTLPRPPLGKLPKVLREYVAALAAATETPSDLALMDCLAVLSAATRGSWEVRVSSKWTETLALWAMSFAPSGLRKSAVLKEAARPLDQREEVLRLEAQRTRAEEQARYEIALQRAKLAQKEAAKDPAGEADEAAAEMRAEAERMRPRPLPKLTTGDATAEALESKMSDQGGALSVFSAESSQWKNFAGRHTGGQVNCDSALKAYTGEKIVTDRITRNGSYIPHPFLAMGLSVQPERVVGLGRTELEGSGFLARWLFAFPRSNLGERTGETPDVPHEIEDAWNRGVTAVLEHADKWRENGRTSERWYRQLTLNPKTQKRLDKFRRELEPRLHPETGDLAHISAWGSKLPGEMLRLAGMFSVLEDPETVLVTLQSLKSALSLTEYLVAHAEASFALLRQEAYSSGSNDRRILEWIADNSLVKFSKKQAYDAVKKQAWVKGRGGADRVQAVLDRLVLAGWIRPLASGSIYKKAGRPPDEWSTHPRLEELLRGSGDRKGPE